MKSILLALAICCFEATAQKIKKLERTSSYSILITGNDFQGILFEEDAFIFPTPQGMGKLKRYSPIVRDALFAEEVIHKEIKENDYVIKDSFLKTNLKKYLRQYAGYVNEQGEKIILVNFAWKKSVFLELKDLMRMPEIPTTNWKIEWYTVLDGGNHYWQAIINITTKKIIDYNVNGEG